MANGGRGARGDGRGSRVRGAGGCLLLMVILAVILLVLSILFGGFQLGKKAGPAPRPPALSLALQRSSR